ncbi:MAG: PAS domain-containing protein [Natrialbaceae archaeon]|nr:PAS domain-containing protein [Natrialbaceae archaeon]
MNEAAIELFGYARRDAVGTALPTLLAINERLDGLAAPTEPAHLTLQTATADGPPIRTSWEVLPLETGAIAFVQDVTEDEKRAQALEVLRGRPNGSSRADPVEHRSRRSSRRPRRSSMVPSVHVRLSDEDRTLDLAGTTAAVGDRQHPIGPGDGILWETFGPAFQP